MMGASPLENWSAFGFVMVSTGILYFNFAWFREQLCIVLCPYGRLQSVLIDDNTLIIGYDEKRGEPRGRLGTPNAGACVGCNRCVQVCPTGIDIRQGLQLECVGCSACIDACDEVMDKVGRPRGLVRYDSSAQFKGQRTQWLRPRTILYGILLLIGASVTLLTFSRVRPANFAVTRMVGTPYVVDANSVRNQFLVRLVNKQTEPAQFFVTTEGGLPMEQTGLTEPITLGAMGEELRPLVLSIDRKHYQGAFVFTLVLHDGKGSFQLKREVKFLGPEAELLREEDREKGIQR
jgi:cytochrome c oxidase accessory protein FixG